MTPWATWRTRRPTSSTSSRGSRASTRPSTGSWRRKKSLPMLPASYCHLWVKIFLGLIVDNILLAGGDASNISCGDSGSNDTTAAATAYTTYTSLSNCSTLVSTFFNRFFTKSLNLRFALLASLGRGHSERNHMCLHYF